MNWLSRSGAMARTGGLATFMPSFCVIPGRGRKPANPESSREAGVPVGRSGSWRGGARQSVVDRLAQAVARDRHHGDAGDAGAVERAQVRKQVGGRLDEVATRREVERGRGALGAGQGSGA